MQLIEKHTFKTTFEQKETLVKMRKKYKINTSKFIRDAINEKLEREKSTIFKKYSALQKYINKNLECPF